MYNPSDIQTYGGEKTDADPVEDPTTDLAASDWNQLINDAAQMTRTAAKVILQFPTISTETNTTPSATKTQWGSGASYYPTTVARSGTGAYTITYPASFVNELGDTETVSFWEATGSVSSATVYGHVQCTASGAVITLKVFDAAGAAVDVTNGTTITVKAW